MYVCVGGTDDPMTGNIFIGEPTGFHIETTKSTFALVGLILDVIIFLFIKKLFSKTTTHNNLIDHD